MSAADKEAWRRWAKAGENRPRRKKKKKKKRKLPRTSLRQAPQIQFTDRVLGTPVVCRDRYAQCTLCSLVEISQVQLSDKVIDVPVFNDTRP